MLGKKIILAGILLMLSLSSYGFITSFPVSLAQPPATVLPSATLAASTPSLVNATHTTATTPSPDNATTLTPITTPTLKSTDLDQGTPIVTPSAAPTLTGTLTEQPGITPTDTLSASATATLTPLPSLMPGISQEPVLVCPADTTPLTLQATPLALFRDRSPSSMVYDLSLTEASSGWLYVAGMVGHPNQGCQSGPDNDGRQYPCDQGQAHEEFTILIDDREIGFVPDHGEDKWEVFSFAIDAALSAGTHQITFKHTQLGTTAESVDYTALLCLQTAPDATDPVQPTASPTLEQTVTPSPVPTDSTSTTPSVTSTASPTLEQTPAASPTSTLIATTTPSETTAVTPLPSAQPTVTLTVTPTDSLTQTPVRPSETPTTTSVAPSATLTQTPLSSTSTPVSPQQPTLPPQPTNTSAAEGCGEIREDENGFPILDSTLCGPDTSSVARTPWAPLEVEAATCPDWLVYHTDMTGDLEIFRLGDLPDHPQADPNLSRGIGARVYDLMPALSPDHRWIAFISNRHGNWEIYVSAVETSLIQRVTYNSFAIDLDPMWSPLGDRIIFASNRDGNWELYLFDVSTGVETRLTTSSGNEINPFWSYDGNTIVYQSDTDGLWQIYALDLTTMDVRRLSDGSAADYAPAYSSDGEHILYRSSEDGENSVIYTMLADGTDVTQVSDPESNALNPVWSPDNRFIAYQSDADGDEDIYVYAVESSETRQVTDNTIADYAPTWYCNAPLLAFTSEVTDDANIFSVPALPVDAPAIRVEDTAAQLTTAQASDQYPLNSPPEENASAQQAFPEPVQSR
jgi:hypothetical protein